MRYEIRPLGPWLGPVTTDRAGSHRFRAHWSDTLDLLVRETEHLGARLVVLQVDVQAGDIRRDRYGVTHTGEQYRGWAQIEAGPAPVMSADEAARILAAESQGRHTADEILADVDARLRAYRLAARRHHPDAGGDPAVFVRITAARDLLDAVAGAGP